MYQTSNRLGIHTYLILFLKNFLAKQYDFVAFVRNFKSKLGQFESPYLYGP